MNSRPALSVVSANEISQPLPHNIEAEQALIGTLLIDNNIYYKVFEIVTAGDFYDPLHGRIYEAISKTIDAGRLADAQTVRAQFEPEEALKPLGGAAAYLIKMIGSVVTTLSAIDYARLIAEKSMRRQLIIYSNEVRYIAHDENAPPEDGEALVSKAETKLFALAEKRETSGAVHGAVVFQEQIDRIDAAYKRGSATPIGIPSGISKLDALIGGFQPGCLYTIAGRPAMGKTAIGLSIAANAAQRGAKVVFHSLEMSRVDIIARLIARETEKPANKQITDIQAEDFQKYENVRQEISSWPIWIDETSKLTAAQIRGRAIRQKRRFGLDLLVIDYLGLMAPSNPMLNRNYQIEEITSGLKTLAKELKIPVLLLAQLNRELEKRDDKRPMLSDLRDSGAVEQDSDVVMFIYRHEYYLTRSEPVRRDRESDEKYTERCSQWDRDVEKSRNKGELICAKHRQGETGTVHLRFMGWKCQFTDLEDEPPS